MAETLRLGGTRIHGAEPQLALLRASTTGPSTSSERKVKFASILDQGDETEFFMVDDGLRAQWIQRYLETVGGLPDETEEPTPEQLSALHRRLMSGGPPFADFAVFTPFNRKLQRVMKFRTWIPNGEGGFTAKEIPGPANYHQWLTCYRVFRTAMVMLDAISLAHLHSYEAVMERLNDLYPTCWHLLISADEKARSEHLVRMKLKVTMAMAAGGPPPKGWDALRPWNALFRLLVDDLAYWQEQVHTPAMVWISRGEKGIARTPAQRLAPNFFTGGTQAIAVEVEGQTKANPGGGDGASRRQSARDKRLAKKKRHAEEREELRRLRDRRDGDGDLVNYKTVEDNKDLAKEELDRLVAAGYAVRSKAGDTEIKTLSKLGLILNTKEDGTLKKRLVIDLRRSGGNDKSRLPERLILPRIQDGVEMIRDLRRCHPQAPSAQETSQFWGMELVMIDISDAFMSLAVHPDEWAHCVSPSTEEGELVTFVALLFGFKTAPLLYSRLGAMVARFLQACVDPSKAMHQVYLDDSLWALQGMLWERNGILAFLLYTMAALGLRVAFKKGERANSLQWIGVKSSVVNMSKVVLTLPKKFMEELREVLQSWSNKGYAPIKELRAAAGRLSWLSGVLSRARWTTAVFYSVLYAAEEEESERTGRLRGLFPVKRLEQARLWLLEFLNTSINSPCRSFPMGANDETPVTITTDASPEALRGGLGGAGDPDRSFVLPWVTLRDARELKFAKGQSSSQGVVEALAIYVALRVWKEKLKGQRLNLTVQSDSVTALALIQRLSNANPGLNFLGAELGILLEELEVEKVVPRLPLTTRQVGQRTRPQHLERAEDRRSSRAGRRLLAAAHTSGGAEPLGEVPRLAPQQDLGRGAVRARSMRADRTVTHRQPSLQSSTSSAPIRKGSEGIRSGAGGGLTGCAGLVAVPQAQHSRCCATCPASPPVIATR